MYRAPGESKVHPQPRCPEPHFPRSEPQRFYSFPCIEVGTGVSSLAANPTQQAEKRAVGGENRLTLIRAHRPSSNRLLRTQCGRWLKPRFYRVRNYQPRRRRSHRPAHAFLAVGRRRGLASCKVHSQPRCPAEQISPRTCSPPAYLHMTDTGASSLADNPGRLG